MECVSDISTFNVWPQLRGQQTWVDVSCLEFTESVHDRGGPEACQEALLQGVRSRFQQTCVECLLFIQGA